MLLEHGLVLALRGLGLSLSRLTLRIRQQLLLLVFLEPLLRLVAGELAVGCAFGQNCGTSGLIGVLLLLSWLLSLCLGLLGLTTNIVLVLAAHKHHLVLLLRVGRW